jgi:hypothetical protein
LPENCLKSLWKAKEVEGRLNSSHAPTFDRITLQL